MYFADTTKCRRFHSSILVQQSHVKNQSPFRQFKSKEAMDNGVYHSNGSGKNEDDSLNVRQTDEVLRNIQRERARKPMPKKAFRGMWLGLTTNEVIGYSVMLMFFVLGGMVYLGALVPQWATVEYRNILMAVMFLYGIYRGVTTYAKASQSRRRQIFEEQRNQDEDIN